MILKINGSEIAVCPSQFTVTTIDLDDGDATQRTADGTMHRDRVAVKRTIEMSWGGLEWKDISKILQATSGVFFDFYYPDPMEGRYITKTFYVGNRPAPVATSQGGKIIWNGLKMTLIEQ